jgi:hypothetical protein
MIDKRFCGGAIAVVTLIVAGASALPELVVRPISAPAVVVPVAVPKAEPVLKSERIAAPEPSAPVLRGNQIDPIVSPQERIAAAAPQPTVSVPEAPKPELVAPFPASPIPPVAFPPVQPVGIAAASAPQALSPANPPATEARPTRPSAEKPARPERAARRPEKPKKTVRPAIYPIGEFLAWRR